MDINLTDIGAYINYTSAAITVVGAIVVVLLDFFVHVIYTPKLVFRIIQSWENKDLGLVKIRIEIENYSTVLVPISPNGGIKLQILPHDILINGRLSEWVEFDRTSAINEEKLKSEPIKKCHWNDPIPIFTTTKQLYPGEIVSGERLHQCPQDSVLHVGLQVKAEYGWLASLSRIHRRKWQEQWTTTIIVMHDKSGVTVQNSQPSSTIL